MRSQRGVAHKDGDTGVEGLGAHLLGIVPQRVDIAIRPYRVGLVYCLAPSVLPEHLYRGRSTDVRSVEVAHLSQVVHDACACCPECQCG